jgi:serine/threonine protein kinase
VQKAEAKPVSNYNNTTNQEEKRKSIITEPIQPLSDVDKKSEIKNMMSRYRSLISEYGNIHVDMERDLSNLGTPRKERFMIVKQPITTEYELSEPFKTDFKKKPVGFRVLKPGNILTEDNDVAKMSIKHLEVLYDGYNDFLREFSHDSLAELKGLATKADPSDGTLNILVLQERFKNDFNTILYEKKVFFSFEQSMDLGLQVVSAIQYLHSHNIPYGNFNIINIYYHTQKKIAKLGTIELLFDIMNRKRFLPEGSKVKYSKPYAYEAPETILNDDQKKEDNIPNELKKDVWALGVILHEFFYHSKPNIPWLDTGKEEYSKDNKALNQKIASSLKASEKRKINMVEPDPNLPKELADLIKDCLQQDPIKRIDIYEVRDRLRKVPLTTPEISKSVVEEDNNDRPVFKPKDEKKKKKATKAFEQTNKEEESITGLPPVKKEGLPAVRRDSLPPVRRFEGNLPELPQRFNEGFKPEFPEPISKEESRRIEENRKIEEEQAKLSENFNSDNQEDETLIKKPGFVKQNSSSKIDFQEQRKLMNEHFSPDKARDDVANFKEKKASKFELSRPITSESQNKGDINVASFNNSRAFMKNESDLEHRRNDDIFQAVKKGGDDVMVVEEFDDDYKIEHKKQEDEEDFAMF